MLAQLQIRLVAKQCELDSTAQAECPQCGRRRHSKGRRSRKVDTVFGQVTLCRSRFTCPEGCDESLPALRGRSTPEFAALRAKFAAHLPYRVVGTLLEEVLPLDRGVSHSTVRRHTFAAASLIEERLARQPAVAPSDITLSLDTAHIRATSASESRHHAVMVGHGESRDGRTRRLAALDHEDAGGQRGEALRTHLDRLGFSSDSSALTVLTDGEDSLRYLVRQATGAVITPILDWFHIAIRLQHATQAARNLSTRVPSHVAATQTIHEELERLHWRLWHGRIDEIDECYDRIGKAVNVYRRHTRSRDARAAPRKMWSHLYDLRLYVRSQSTLIVNYAERQRNGERASTSVVESAVNHVVNHRMNKKRQMRWSRAGAHKLLQVRTAVINGDFDELMGAIRKTAHVANDSTYMLLAA